MQDKIPRIDPALTPPRVHFTAALAHRAFAGAELQQLLDFVWRPTPTRAEQAALLLDSAAAQALSFRSVAAETLQARALAWCQLYRVAPGDVSARPLRVLALMAPGDMMVNTPLDFITAHLDVQLDLQFVRPDAPLPFAVPEHDVAFFAVSESDPAALRRLAPLFESWPRPALNDPRRAARLSRDGVARAMARLPGCAAPEIAEVSRAALRRDGLAYPALLRPFGSHAGHDLARLDGPDDLSRYLAAVAGERFYAANFIDYRSPDGLYRKYRVALVDGRPFLCHMAASAHWMVHYLNAGMAESAAKRALEAEAMATFDGGFARRHAAALRAIDDWIGLDYAQIDCAELADGRLLVFEADTAAIIHMMDPPDLYPYKRPAMRRVIDAFGDMLRSRAAAMAV